jgi:methyl-accepting chemotaxis protein
VIVVLAVSVIAALAIGAVVAGGIVKRIRRTAAVFDQMADGDLTPRVETTHHDEITQMGHALNRTLDRTSDVMAAIDDSAAQLSSAAEAFTTRNTHLSTVADTVATDATTVASGSRDVSAGLETVAAAAQEMSTAVHDVSNAAHQAAQSAAQAVDVALTAQTAIGRLGTSSNEVNAVVRLIDSIAEQTNLLALNATIEAARAGEAGRGFAIVANEVKDLSHDTTTATQEIAARVQTIQTDTNDAITAITTITTIIDTINNLQGQIAAAVEQQAAMTEEITRTLANVATNGHHIDDGIHNVTTAIADTTTLINDIDTDSQNLAHLADHLHTLTSRFQFAAPPSGLPPVLPINDDEVVR